MLLDNSIDIILLQKSNTTTTEDVLEREKSTNAEQISIRISKAVVDVYGYVRPIMNMLMFFISHSKYISKL